MAKSFTYNLTRHTQDLVKSYASVCYSVQQPTCIMIDIFYIIILLFINENQRIKINYKNSLHMLCICKIEQLKYLENPKTLGKNKDLKIGKENYPKTLMYYS